MRIEGVRQGYRLLQSLTQPASSMTKYAEQAMVVLAVADAPRPATR